MSPPYGTIARVTAPSEILDTAPLRKARGAFFTPEPLARYVTDWAVRGVADKVLEPSCGEAAFLLAAVDRLTALRDAERSTTPPHLDGVELHEASAEAARGLLADAGVSASVRVGDFFTVDPTGSYDAVIGNPPYVRYQDFSGESRTRSREAALRAGVPVSNLASSWAAFTIHSALFLRKGGRMGLVLPAELLSVNYAAPIRRFLLERFASVDLVLFDERVFPEAEVDAVLLLAEGFDEGPTDHFRVIQVRDGEGLAKSPVARSWTPTDLDAKWTPSLLSPDALTAFANLSASDGFVTLEDWGDTTLGMVTGSNRFFALSPTKVADLGLSASDVVRLSPPGSKHLRGLTFTKDALDELGAAGGATYLFRPSGEPSEAALRYIEAGKVSGVNEAYKCRIRGEGYWWRVPLLKPADLLLTYMNADTPRLCSNKAGARHLNSVHGVYLRPGLKRLAMDYLPLASINSMTLLGAETVGRSYGGGMLKVEPREADRLPMPSPDVVKSIKSDLALIRPQMGRLLRSGRLIEAARLVDDLLLVRELGLTRSAVKSLRDDHADLTARRSARGGKARA